MNRSLRRLIYCKQLHTGLRAGLFFGLLTVLNGATAQSASLPLGEPVNFTVSELAAFKDNNIILTNGSAWQTNMQQLGLPGTRVLISGRNLRSGTNELQLHGFTFTARHQAGEFKGQKGYKHLLLAVQADGRRLLLSENLTAFVLDSDRLHTRNWAANNTVILSDDLRSLVYLPSLTTVTVQLTRTTLP